MKQEVNFQIVDYDKFPELVKLWNTWNIRTVLMSNGNCDTQEWDDLIAYGKEHQNEVAEFIYDMFENNIPVGWPAMALMDSSLDTPVIRGDGYVNPMWKPVQDAYRKCCGLMCGRITSEME